MADDYVRTKIQEALDASGGDRHDAQKLLVTWAVRDQALLLGFAKTSLKALVAARLEHELRGDAQGRNETGHVTLTKKDVRDLMATRTVSEKRKSTVPPPKSSHRQANVMHKLAEAFKNKKK